MTKLTIGILIMATVRNNYFKQLMNTIGSNSIIQTNK